MERLSLSNYNPDFRSKRDIETAIVWNAIKKTLENVWRQELFPYIKSVRVSEATITLITEKPIITVELQIYKESLVDTINTSLLQIASKPRTQIRIQ